MMSLFRTLLLFLPLLGTATCPTGALLLRPPRPASGQSGASRHARHSAFGRLSQTAAAPPRESSSSFGRLKKPEGRRQQGNGIAAEEPRRQEGNAIAAEEPAAIVGKRLTLYGDYFPAGCGQKKACPTRGENKPEVRERKRSDPIRIPFSPEAIAKKIHDSLFLADAAWVLR